MNDVGELVKNVENELGNTAIAPATMHLHENETSDGDERGFVPEASA